MEEFRLRFRNISRIMDCVTCEKCRVWGKLQILGLGTAIKILLTPEAELASSVSLSRGVLNRQEVIALVNTLHQLSKSVGFAARVGEGVGGAEGAAGAGARGNKESAYV